MDEAAGSGRFPGQAVVEPDENTERGERFVAGVTWRNLWGMDRVASAITWAWRASVLDRAGWTTAMRSIVSLGR